MSGPLLLTGASGWFGRTALWEYEQAHGPEALRGDVRPFASKECMVDFDSPHGPVMAQPLSAITEVPHPRGLLHLAFLTRDKVEELGLRRYVETNRSITATVARLLRQWPTMPVVATSSGAAAALDGKDPDLEGNPYATLKQEEEKLLQQESDTRMSMVFRVYAASGRFMTRPEKFALGDFLLQAIRGEPVRVRSPHPVIRSYVNVEQMMRLAWRLLSESQPQYGYSCVDACTHTVTLTALASMVAGAFAADCSLPDEATKLLSVIDRYAGDQDFYIGLSSGFGISVVDLEQQIRDTALGLKRKV
jgi:nucleoside-diphosphate-sugar epimerase